MGIKIIYLMVLTKITEKESPLKKMKSNIIPKVWGFSPLKGGRGGMWDLIWIQMSFFIIIIGELADIIYIM